MRTVLYSYQEKLFSIYQHKTAIFQFSLDIDWMFCYPQTAAVFYFSPTKTLLFLLGHSCFLISLRKTIVCFLQITAVVLCFILSQRQFLISNQTNIFSISQQTTTVFYFTAGNILLNIHTTFKINELSIINFQLCNIYSPYIWNVINSS